MSKPFLVLIFALPMMADGPILGPPSSACGQEQVALAQGVSVPHELKRRECHEYGVSLLAGQFFEMVVDQDGVDVTTSLFDPEWRRLALVDSLNGTYGPEPLLAIVEQAGKYRIRIAAGGGGGPSGRYTLRITEIRPPQPGDAEHVAAARKVEDAVQRFGSGKGEDRKEAIRLAREALQYYDASGDTYEHAMALFSLGYFLAQQSEARAAIDDYTRALDIFRLVGDRIMEARALNNLGGEYTDLGEPLPALHSLHESLAVLAQDQEKTRGLRAAALNNIQVIYDQSGNSMVFDETGNAGDELAAYRRAAADFGAMGAWKYQARAIRNIASVYQKTNEPESALRYLDQSLQLIREKKIDDASLKPDVLTQKAEVLLSQGKPQEARVVCEEALDLRKAAGDSRRTADTRSVMAVIDGRLNDPDRALELLDQALPAQREFGSRLSTVTTLLNMAQIHLSQRRWPEASERLEEAASTANDLGCVPCQTQAAFGLAQVRQALGDPSGALAQIKHAAARLEDRRSSIASEPLRASFLGGNQQIYELYIELALHAPEGGPALAFEASEQARARALLDTLGETHVLPEGVHDKLQSIKNDLAVLQNARITLWQRPGSDQEIKEEQRLDNRIQELEREYDAIEGEQARANRGYAAITKSRIVTAAEVQSRLDAETVFLEYYLGDRKSYLWAITAQGVSEYDLPPRARIAAACQALRRLLQEPNAPAGPFIHAARQLSALVLNPAGEALRHKRWIIAADGALHYIPFAALTAPGESASPGSQASTPAAWGAYHPLVLEHEIVNVPSASTMAAQRELLAGRTPAPRELAVLADPVFSNHDPRFGPGAVRAPEDDPHGDAHGDVLSRLLEHGKPGSGARDIPRLPYAGIEAKQIFSLAAPRASMEALGFAATRKLASGPDLGQYKYLHFATHGYMDSRDPRQSFLVFSRFDKNRKPVPDSVLLLQDIFGLHLNADLVVLSACETGLGREIRGEGLVGFARAFMYAGAARVLASLWAVNDQGTSKLMPAFYESLWRKGRSPAAALREAQLRLLRDPRWSSPYYWAPFTLEGEWK